MKQTFLLILSVLISISLWAQNEINPNGFNQFFHENGKVSSEGYMKNGQPDGYWKTYNEEGILISEGNRVNYQLDSLWKFYNDEGNLTLEITYKEGKKNGIRRTWSEDEILEENFVNDVKQGFSSTFFAEGKNIKRKVNYVDGLEEGNAWEYAEDGRIITILFYKRGFITNRERINRYDQQNEKHGIWRYYHEDGSLKWEGNYKHGTRDGYFKEYAETGDLISTTKYEDGIIKEDVAELVRLDIKKDYYPNGNVRVIATYKDGVPEGIRREFNENGEVEQSYIFKNGRPIAEGILTEKGERDGFWKEYYDEGGLKAEGKYVLDVKVGEWKFYHRNGILEQIGTYTDKGLPDGVWKWFYDSGRLLREENFYRGLPDGLLTEYDIRGNVITQGEFIEGLEEGRWIYEMGDHREEGEYVEGLRNGEWVWYFDNGKKSFEGKFIDDNPNGRHVYYWRNGNVKLEGNYIMGRRDGEWKKYSSDGVPVILISYKNGRELKYDGVKVNKEDIIGGEDD